MSLIPGAASTRPPGLPEAGTAGDLFAEVFRRLEALERAARLTHSSVGSGGLRVHSGGKITLEDETGSPRVVLDSSGLAVDGGQVLAVHVDVKEAGNPVNIDNIHNENEELATATFTLPAWVATARVLAAATVRGANSTDGPLMVVCEARINHVFDGASGSTAADHATVTVVHFDERTQLRRHQRPDQRVSPRHRRQDLLAGQVRRWMTGNSTRRCSTAEGSPATRLKNAPISAD